RSRKFCKAGERKRDVTQSHMHARPGSACAARAGDRALAIAYLAGRCSRLVGFRRGRRKRHAAARAPPGGLRITDRHMSNTIAFRLNGREVRLDSVSPNTTLLDWLRAQGLTGSKEGCAEGDCGACSVAIVDRDRHGKPCFRSINSCLIPLPLMAGRDIITVEGVACSHGALSPCKS